MCGGGGGLLGPIQSIIEIIVSPIVDAIDHVANEINNEIIQPVFDQIEDLGGEVGKFISKIDWKETGKNFLDTLYAAFHSSLASPTDRYEEDPDFWTDEQKYGHEQETTALENFFEGIRDIWSSIHKRFDHMVDRIESLRDSLNGRMDARMDELKRLFGEISPTDTNMKEKLNAIVIKQLAQFESEVNDFMIEEAATSAHILSNKPMHGSDYIGWVVASDGSKFFSGADVDSKNDYDVYTITYDASDKVDFEWTRYDTGVYRFIDFDNTNQNDWSQKNEYYKNGIMFSKEVMYDNGNKLIETYDIDEVYAEWDYFQDYYDSNGDIDYEWVNSKDGSKWMANFDQTNSENWHTFWYFYNKDGALIRQTVQYDDNTTSDTYFDVADIESWSEHLINLDSSGLCESEFYTFDDGSMEYIRHNTQSGGEYLYYSNSYNREGKLSSHFVANKDATSLYVQYDVNGAFHWDKVVTLKDNFGKIIKESILIDTTNADDKIVGSDLPDYVNGFLGNDKINGNGGDDELRGGDGNDELDGGAGADLLNGEAGNDTYVVDNAKDIIVEAVGGGRDTVVTTVSYRLAVGQSVEVLQTADSNGKAALNLTGNEFTNKLVGNAGNNVLDGGRGVDEMRGGAGNDTYVVDNAKDIIVEAVGGGRDTVVTTVSYRLAVGQSVESLRLTKTTGSANLTGNEFGQSLTGSAGANVLDGGLGADVLTGGKSADTFVFSSKLGPSNVDHIADFTGTDTVCLSKSIFSALAPGELKANEFKDIAKTKVDADDHILYDSRSGGLFYDADGSGKAAAIKFAVLDNKAALTATDFFIV